jgi:hypothetical protein
MASPRANTPSRRGSRRPALHLPRCCAGQPLSSKIGSSIQLPSRRNPLHHTMMATSNSVPRWTTGNTSRTPLTLASTRSASGGAGLRLDAQQRDPFSDVAATRGPPSSRWTGAPAVACVAVLLTRVVANGSAAQADPDPVAADVGPAPTRPTHLTMFTLVSPLPYGLGANVGNCRCLRASSVPPGSARRLPPRPRSCRRHGRVGVCSGTGSDSRRAGPSLRIYSVAAYPARRTPGGTNVALDLSSVN